MSEALATDAEIDLVRVAKASARRCIERGRPSAGLLDVAMLHAATASAHADGRAPTGIVTLLSEIHQATKRLVNGCDISGHALSGPSVRWASTYCIELCERVERGDPGRYAWLDQ